MIVHTYRAEAAETIRLINKELDSIAEEFIRHNGAANPKLSKRRAALQKSRAQYQRAFPLL